MGKKSLVVIEEGNQTASAAFGCAEILDAGLEEVLGSASEEEEVLSNGGGLALRIGRRLVFLRRNFETAKEALARVGDELSRWRRRRDRAHEKLYDLAKRLRGFSRGLYGKQRADEFLGLRGTLPRDPGKLHLKLGPVLGRLADENWPIPTHNVEGFKIDRAKLVKA
ncbi:MAG: hypothetical protein V3T72_06565 [Thermoanaerobaculia bacterium]